MIIRTDICGGNLIVDRQDGQTLYVQQDTSTTSEWWFHWRFRMEELNAGEKWHVIFTNGDVISPRGPAMCTNLEDWHFQHEYEKPGCEFTFEVPDGVAWAEFAFSLPYDPEDFEKFIKQYEDRPYVHRDVLCTTLQGREVPMLRIGHENAHGRMILTARHHACETTGNYLIEGILQYMLDRDFTLTYPLLQRYQICLVPFMDYDGVVTGAQGKFSLPHDHFVDYTEEPIYPSVAAVQALARGWHDLLAVDSHSPARWNRQNDHSFIARPNTHLKTALEVGRFLWELCLKADPKDTLIYEMIYDKRVDTDWRGNFYSDEKVGLIKQKSAPDFTEYFCNQNAHSVLFETPYFGTAENPTTQQSMRNLGKLVGRALELYVQCL